MTLFEKNFLNMLEKTKNSKSYDQTVETMKLELQPKDDTADKDAIIILGYSGNGKTTWSKRFVKKNPEFEIFSWDDEVIKQLNGRSYNEMSGKEQISAIGKALEEKSDYPLVLDGNYLNLPLRVAILNTLHGYGYNVYLADLTPILEQTLPCRIEDTIKKYKQNPKNAQYSDDYIRMCAQINTMRFKQDEEFRSAFPEQQKRQIVELGSDGVIDINSYSIPPLKPTQK